MYHMVLLVLNDPDLCPSVLEAWEAAGAPGITILESTGLGRMRQSAIRDDLPLLPSIADLFRSKEIRHRTLFTVVEDESLVDELISVTEAIVGELDNPDNGFLVVLPVSRAVGLKGGQERARKYRGDKG